MIVNKKCEECGKEFEYDEKSGYPRKYCFSCGAAKKASYAGQGQQPKKEEKVSQSALKTGYHLTPEQVNSNALDLAMKFMQFHPQECDKLDMWQVAVKMKEWING